MAINNAADYDHIDVVNGADTNRHMLKDAQARQDVADLKSALTANEKRAAQFAAGGVFSIVGTYGHASNRGVEWVGDGVKVNFSGTVTSGFASNYVLYDNSDSLPSGMQSGETFRASISGTSSVLLQIYSYKNGALSPIVSVDSSSAIKEFVLANDVEGLLIRLRIEQAGAISGTVTPMITAFASIIDLEDDVSDLDEAMAEVQPAVDGISEKIVGPNLADPHDCNVGYNLSGTGAITKMETDFYSVTPFYTIHSGESIYVNKFRKFLVRSLDNATQIHWVDGWTSDYIYTASADCIYRIQFGTDDGLFVSYSASIPASQEPYFAPYYVLTPQTDSFAKSIAHQGYNKEAPNQTMAAYKAAVLHGFKWVECDINYTQDGYLVCCHNDIVYADTQSMVINPMLGSASGGYTTAITLANTTLATLQSYSWGAWKSSEYAGESILLLEDLIKYCKINGIHLFLDHAYQALSDATRRAALFAMLDKYGMHKNVTFATANTVVPAWHEDVAMAISTPTYSDSVLDQAKNLKTSYPDAKIAISMPYDQVTDAISLAVHNAGIDLYAFTVDSWELICDIALICDAVFSNDYTVEDAIYRQNNR